MEIRELWVSLMKPAQLWPLGAAERLEVLREEAAAGAAARAPESAEYVPEGGIRDMRLRGLSFEDIWRALARRGGPRAFEDALRRHDAGLRRCGHRRRGRVRA